MRQSKRILSALLLSFLVLTWAACSSDDEPAGGDAEQPNEDTVETVDVEPDDETPADDQDPIDAEEPDDEEDPTDVDEPGPNAEEETTGEVVPDEEDEDTPDVPEVIGDPVEQLEEPSDNCNFRQRNTHDYYFCRPVGGITWTGARDNCDKAGGALVSVNDAAENQFVLDNIQVPISNMWIGYNDIDTEKQHEWVGGNSSYENWSSGPHGQSEGNDCVYMLPSGAGEPGTWVNALCAADAVNLEYACEASSVDGGEKPGEVVTDANPNGFPAAPGGMGEAGPFEPLVYPDTGPDDAFTIFAPDGLGEDDIKHPIVIWGNGTGNSTGQYGPLLQHLASHGFVVVSPNSGALIDGELVGVAAGWIVAQGEGAGGTFSGKLDTSKIAAVGHSQGGIAAVDLAAGNDLVGYAVAISGGSVAVTALDNPYLLLGGSDDAFVTPGILQPQFDNISVPMVMAILEGGDYVTAYGNAGPYRRVVTGWLRLHLLGDTTAQKQFYGPDCGLCTDDSWTVQRNEMDSYKP